MPIIIKPTKTKDVTFRSRINECLLTNFMLSGVGEPNGAVSTRSAFLWAQNTNTKKWTSFGDSVQPEHRSVTSVRHRQGFILRKALIGLVADTARSDCSDTLAYRKELLHSIRHQLISSVDDLGFIIPHQLISDFKIPGATGCHAVTASLASRQLLYYTSRVCKCMRPMVVKLARFCACCLKGSLPYHTLPYPTLPYPTLPYPRCNCFLSYDEWISYDWTSLRLMQECLLLQRQLLL